MDHDLTIVRACLTCFQTRLETKQVFGSKVQSFAKNWLRDNCNHKYHFSFICFIARIRSSCVTRCVLIFFRSRQKSLGTEIVTLNDKNNCFNCCSCIILSFLDSVIYAIKKQHLFLWNSLTLLSHFRCCCWQAIVHQTRCKAEVLVWMSYQKAFFTCLN